MDKLITTVTTTTVNTFDLRTGKFSSETKTTTKTVRISEEYPFDKLLTRCPSHHKHKRFRCRCGSRSAIADLNGIVHCAKCNRVAPFSIGVEIRL